MRTEQDQSHGGGAEEAGPVGIKPRLARLLQGVGLREPVAYQVGHAGDGGLDGHRIRHHGVLVGAPVVEGDAVEDLVGVPSPPGIRIDGEDGIRGEGEHRDEQRLVHQGIAQLPQIAHRRQGIGRQLAISRPWESLLQPRRRCWWLLALALPRRPWRRRRRRLAALQRRAGAHHRPGPTLRLLLLLLLLLRPLWRLNLLWRRAPAARPVPRQKRSLDRDTGRQEGACRRAEQAKDAAHDQLARHAGGPP